jgi:transposase
MTTRAGKRRDPVKEQFWRTTIADQARSGLSVRAFCEREGLRPCNFHWWRQALARRDREVQPTRIVRRPNSMVERPMPTTFLPVRVLQEVIAPIAAATPIEIVLPAGLTVRVLRGFDPIALEEVLSVLEARTC